MKPATRMDLDQDPGTESEDEEVKLRAALIRCSALSVEAVSKISHAARVLDVSFSEAALSTGFVSQEDVDYARQSYQPPQPRQKVARIGTELALSRSPFDARSEQLLALRTELLLRFDSDSGANMLALISPSAGEGRSRLCAELALSFAQLGHPTLLVDADFRNPKQHILFESENEHGLSRAIAKHESPRPETVEGIPQLSLLTAGPKPVNPLELLSDGHFQRMVRDWQNSYEFVVIDTAPVTTFSDGLAVATLVGRVLAVSRANHTGYRQQREMLRKLAVTRAQILGAVINYF
ncbi:MAG: hypothetical protein NVS9B10_23060 [Nevskia sp.]